MEGFHLQQFYYMVRWLKKYENEVLLRLDFINTVWQMYIVPGTLIPGGLISSGPSMVFMQECVLNTGMQKME